jgi:hypothetical protein
MKGRGPDETGLTFFDTANKGAATTLMVRAWYKAQLSLRSPSILENHSDFKPQPRASRYWRGVRCVADLNLRVNAL